MKLPNLFSSISRRLIAFSLFIVVVPMIIAGVYLGIRLNDFLERNFIEASNSELKQIDNIISYRLEEVENNTEMLANNYFVKQADESITSYLDKSGNNELLEMRPSKSDGIEAEIYREYENFAQTHPNIAYVYLATVEGGYVQWPEGKTQAEYDPRERPFYQEAIKNADTVVRTEPYLDPTSEDIVISTAKTVNDESDNLIGVQGVDISLAGLSEMLKEVNVGESVQVMAVDKDGTILANPEDEELNFKPIEELGIHGLDNFSEIEAGGLEVECDEQSYYANAYQAEDFDWYFLALIESSELRAEINELLKLILGITISLIILALTVAILLSKKISKPLESVADQSRKMADDKLRKSLLAEVVDVDYSQKVNGNYIEEKFSDFAGKMEDKWLARDDEVGVLARSYQAMKDNLINLVESLAAYGEEITQLNQKLEYQAFHDSLTKLPNRRRFIKELEEELEQEKKGAILLLDLDDFKEINDILGHFYGDKLLTAVGKRLLSLNEDEIFVARYGGDEFLLLVRYGDNEYLLAESLKKVDALFQDSFVIKNEEIDVNYSLGIALYPENSDSTDQLITMADTAMYQAKSLGKQYLYYNQQMVKALKKRKRIKRILKDALATDGFVLKYQPQVDITTGKASHVEALLRLQDYNISPGQFIPIAEESNLIIEMGRWVTKAAIKQLASWRDKGFEAKSIAINFSVKQLKDDGYIDFIAAELQEWGVEPSLIEIEITESILLNKEKKAIEYLTELKELGVKISLDDFGTGYSSLNYLTYIELDKIKLDKSLTDRFLQEDKLDVMENLINLFHNLELPVVAEGIEIVEQYKKLASKNCDYIQGYLFSKPIKVDEIEREYEKNYISEVLNK